MSKRKWIQIEDKDSTTVIKVRNILTVQLFNSSPDTIYIYLRNSKLDQQPSKQSAGWRSFDYTDAESAKATFQRIIREISKREER
jgi:hypothetical protein